MKKLLPQMGLMFLLLLPLLLPQLGRAQEIRVSGRVVDGDTQEPVAFPMVRLLDAKSTILGDEYGFFQIAGAYSSKTDSVIITTLGHTRCVIPFVQNKEQKLVVKLCRLYELAEPPIGAMKLDFEMGDNHKPFPRHAELISSPEAKYAFLIRNEQKDNIRKIKSISLYVGDNGFPREDFRVHIYTVSKENKAPQDKIFSSREIYPVRNGDWCTLDLRNVSVALPHDAYFVSLEFVVPEGIGSNNQNYLYDYVPSGRIMRPTFEPSERSGWSYIDGAWKEFPVDNSSYRRFKAMIQVEVE